VTVSKVLVTFSNDEQEADWRADMAPELKENKEFAEWLEQWVARIQSRVLVDHTRSEGETSPQEHQQRNPISKTCRTRF
jgi:tellurite resistance protein